MYMCVYMYVWIFHLRMYVCIYVCSNDQHKFMFHWWWHLKYCNWSRIVLPTCDISLHHYCISGCGLENTKLPAWKVRVVHITLILLFKCNICFPPKSALIMMTLIYFISSTCILWALLQCMLVYVLSRIRTRTNCVKVILCARHRTFMQMTSEGVPSHLNTFCMRNVHVWAWNEREKCETRKMQQSWEHLYLNVIGQCSKQHVQQVKVNPALFIRGRSIECMKGGHAWQIQQQKIEI